MSLHDFVYTHYTSLFYDMKFLHVVCIQVSAQKNTGDIAVGKERHSLSLQTVYTV